MRRKYEDDRKKGVYKCCCCILIYTYVHAIVFCAILRVDRNNICYFVRSAIGFAHYIFHRMSEKREYPFPQDVIDGIYLHNYTLTRCDILICSYNENKVEVLDNLVVEQSPVQSEKPGFDFRSRHLI